VWTSECWWGGGTTCGHAILEHMFALLHHEWLDLGLETALHNSMLCNPLARSLEHKLSCTQILDAGNIEDLRETQGHAYHSVAIVFLSQDYFKMYIFISQSYTSLKFKVTSFGLYT
jgi:hypothetical protein